MRVVRVLPDVPAIDKEFDYLVPEAWEADGRAARVEVGSMVLSALLIVVSVWLIMRLNRADIRNEFR